MGKVYGYLVVSAGSILLAESLPMKLIAEAVLAFCFAAAFHAVLFRVYAWMYRTSWREVLGRYVSDRTVYKCSILVMAGWLAVGVFLDHGSPARVITVEGAFFLGVWITLHPRDVRRGLLAGLRERL
jgi:hypothetical protein